MLIGLAGAVLAGLILGLYGRAAAIVLMSMLVFCLAVPISMLSEWSFGYSVLITFGILTFMQIGFLVGLFIYANSSRYRKWLPFLYPEGFHTHELQTSKTAE